MHRPGGHERKSIYDPVHGPISLSPLAVDLIGTPAFQRLWGIRQMGLAHLVFPGANHTRLEHSLGTFWVAQRVADRLGITGERRAVLESAALLHDLGHTPFSHTLEPTLREVEGHGHERRSRAAIEGDGLGGTEIPAILGAHGLAPREVADLIDPAPTRRVDPLLRGLLHGAIDADRLDYLQRDAHYTGVALGAVDVARLWDTLVAFRGRVAFAAKARTSVEGFLVGRALMYAAVYYHKTVRAAELLAQAVLERCDGYPERARAILDGDDARFLVALADDPAPATRRLLDRLRRRRLPKRVAALPEIPAETEGWARRLLRRPSERREWEDRWADRLGGTAGDVLLDLSGVEPRDGTDEDGTGIVLVEAGRATRPFRHSAPWTELARRPPTDVRLAVYASAELRERAARTLARRGIGPD
ncbi:MAG: HD domain-containing protein [Thermoplasmata archaeon]